MDIVYLVKNSPVNEELTYSLRSIKNLPHGKVFIVGGCPQNINKVAITHIPALQNGDKFQNTTRSLELACKSDLLSEDFILMNDDFFVLQGIVNPREELNLCRGYIDEVLAEYTRFYGISENTYIQGMRQTKAFLEDLGIKNPLSYELHIPIIMAKNGLLRAFSLPALKTIRPGHIRTIYGNLYLKGSKLAADVKVRNAKETISTGKFLSTADYTWPIVKPKIQELFPDKSEYEL